MRRLPQTARLGQTTPAALGGNITAAPGSAADIITQGRLAEATLYGGQGPQIAELPSDLAEVEGMTKELYDQWASLKSFADTMWHNYRVDVTKPDTRNPVAMQAHLAFQKALASIQYTANALKNQQKLIQAAQAQALQGHGYFAQDPTQKLHYDPAEFFTPIAAHPLVTAANQAHANDVMTREAQRFQAEEQRRNREYLLSLAEQAERDKKPGLAAYYRQRAAELQTGAYVDPGLVYPNRFRGGSQQDEMDLFNELVILRRGLYDNDPNAFSRLAGTSDKILEVRPFYEGDKSGVLITRVAANNTVVVEPLYFDETGDYTEDLKRLNDYLNKLNPTKYSVPSSRLAPYFEQVKGHPDLQLPARPTGEAYRTLKNLLIGLSKRSITNRHEAFLERLQALAKQGKLIDPQGRPIVEVDRSDGFFGLAGWLRGYGLVLRVDRGDGVVEDLKIDTENPAYADYLDKFLRNNSGYLIDIGQRLSAPIPNQQIGEMDEAGNVSLIDPRRTTTEAESLEALRQRAREYLKEYERLKQQQSRDK